MAESAEDHYVACCSRSGAVDDIGSWRIRVVEAVHEGGVGVGGEASGRRNKWPIFGQCATTLKIHFF